MKFMLKVSESGTSQNVKGLGLYFQPCFFVPFLMKDNFKSKD